MEKKALILLMVVVLGLGFCFSHLIKLFPHLLNNRKFERLWPVWESPATCGVESNWGRKKPFSHWQVEVYPCIAHRTPYPPACPPQEMRIWFEAPRPCIPPKRDGARSGQKRPLEAKTNI